MCKTDNRRAGLAEAGVREPDVRIFGFPSHGSATGVGGEEGMSQRGAKAPGITAENPPFQMLKEN